MCPDWEWNWHLLMHRTSSSPPSRPGHCTLCQLFADDPSCSERQCIRKGEAEGGTLTSPQSPAFWSESYFTGLSQPPTLHPWEPAGAPGRRFHGAFPSATRSTARSQRPLAFPFSQHIYRARLLLYRQAQGPAHPCLTSFGESEGSVCCAGFCVARV